MIPETVLEDCRQERDAAIKVVAAVFGCDNARVTDTIKLIHRHGDGIIELAGIFLSANLSTDWNFAAIVEGVQVYVLNKIEEEISEAQYWRLEDVRIDTSSGVGNWRVSAHTDEHESEANAFVSMCQHGINPPAIAMMQGLDRPEASE